MIVEDLSMVCLVLVNDIAEFKSYYNQFLFMIDNQHPKIVINIEYIEIGIVSKKLLHEF